MTTRPKASTLPSYTYLFPSETPGIGYLVTSGGDITQKDTFALVPGGIAPYNAAPVTAVAPNPTTVKGQNASASFAAVGGNVLLAPGVGSVSNVSGNVQIADTSGNGGGWNNAHLQLGNYHFWVDSSGRLRVKSSAPVADTDGTVVGGQS